MNAKTATALVAFALAAFVAAPGRAATTPQWGTLTTPFSSTTIGQENTSGRAQVASNADTTSAPMPDSEMYAPVLKTLGPVQPEFKPSLFRPQRAYHGEGYVFGSTVQGSQERHLAPTPGVNISVPLD